MTHWHYKHMDILSTISRKMSDDESVSEPARALFKQAHALADALRHTNLPESVALEKAFSAMCQAYKLAALCACTPDEASFHRCRIVQIYLAD